MEADRAFSFKLFVPPRVSCGPMSAVRPQEKADKCGDCVNSFQQDYSMCFEKGQNMAFPNSSMATATKPTRQDFPKMKVVPPMEKEVNKSDPGELHSKLLVEVEKLKEWKVKLDSETAQKERRLQESKRTIETQRKAIHELQFESESLSSKLEEQISENEDLRNKDNATRNLCNILKDTFQRSTEKMHLFESEREETHQLFLQNSQSIEKLIEALENLCMRVEADQQELHKVKQGLLQFEEVKQKYCHEYNMKEAEVSELQTILSNKENELQKLMLDLHETQKHCKELQETTDQQDALLKSSETKLESLLQQLQTAEHQRDEIKKNRKQIAAALKQSKDECAEIIQSKDLSLQELGRVMIQQAEKLEQIHKSAEDLHSSLASEMQRAQELEEKLAANNEERETRLVILRESMEQNIKKDEKIEILEKELDIKLKSIESMEDKIKVAGVRVEEMADKLSKKSEEVHLIKSELQIASAENDLLKKACQAAEKAHEDLNKKSTATELKVQELEQQLFTDKKKNKEDLEQLQEEAMHHKAKHEELLSCIDELQSEKMVIQQQLESGLSNAKATEESEKKAAKHLKDIERLEKENLSLKEEIKSFKSRVQRKCHETETLQKKIEEKWDLLQEKVTEKEKQIKTVEAKLCNIKRKVEIKLKAQGEYQKENKTLQKKIAKEIMKSSQLENVISDLREDTLSLKKLNEKDHQKLLKDLEYKSTLTEELVNEVQKLRVTAAEAVKRKEEAELKCQHKIADMVTLMEKHKSQYDRMVEEKDTELEDNKKRELEAVEQRKSLELDLLKNKTEYNQLKKELMTETTKTETLHKELADLKAEMSSMQFIPLSEARSKQSPAPNHKQRGFSETPKECALKRHVFDFSKTRRTPSGSRDDASAEPDTEPLRSLIVTPKKREFHNDLIHSRTMTYRDSRTPKIQSYRIRTPPSDKTAGSWKKSTIELDPKSDSSDHDLLTFASESASVFSASHCKLNTFKKTPVTHKSPGNFLKLAAMKRMRDAGWTAVTSCDKKKKKNSEKIFA